MIDLKTKTVHCSKHGDDFVASVIVLGGTEVVSPCPLCEVEDKKEKIKSDVVDIDQQKKKAAVKRLSLAGIPPRYQNRTFSNYHAGDAMQKRALDTAVRYSQMIADSGSSGAGLVITGNVGTGKTHLACAVGMAYLQGSGSVAFVSVSGMIRKIRETYRNDSKVTEQDAINAFRDVDLLIIDEIGVQKGTDSEENLLFEVINERYAHLKPTVIISNLNADEIKQYIGVRALDRLSEDGGKFIACDWGSYRGNKQKGVKDV